MFKAFSFLLGLIAVSPISVTESYAAEGGRPGSDVNIVTPVDRSFELGVDYRLIFSDCDAPCVTTERPDFSLSSLIHTVNVSVVAGPNGNLCKAKVGILNRAGGMNVEHTLLTVYATEQSPGVITFTYTNPIQIASSNDITFRLVSLTGDGDCQGAASIGLELLD